MIGWAALLVAAGFVVAVPAHAQDFAGARHALDPDAPGSMLDEGLPSPHRAAWLEATSTRWWNLAELEARALGGGLGLRAGRVAAGLSQTGAPDVGWQSVALAVGAADDESGAAVRALARRELVDGAVGGEAGAGAWLRIARGVTLAASAPQLWTRGESPPLVRPATLGVRVRAELAEVWAALEGPAADAPGERVLGAELAVGPAQVWGEARGAPWRVALGAGVAVGALRVVARVDGHAALGETWRMGLLLRRPRSAP